MSTRHASWTAAAALLVLLTTAACSSTDRARTQTDDASAQAPSASDSAPDDLEALYWARQDSARMAFTEADVRFMEDMIAHHAQALIMSRMAPTHGASPEVQTLAARIINSQKDEIASMQAWLRRRGQPVPEVHIDGLELMIHTEGDASESGHGETGHSGMSHGGMDHSDMAGMLSPAQLRELDAARGAAFDRLFLKYMIQHHGGAVTMVDTLFSTDGAALDDAAFKLASDINADQQTEIARMQKMLDALPASSGGAR